MKNINAICLLILSTALCACSTDHIPQRTVTTPLPKYSEWQAQQNPTWTPSKPSSETALSSECQMFRERKNQCERIHVGLSGMERQKQMGACLSNLSHLSNQGC